MRNLSYRLACGILLIGVPILFWQLMHLYQLHGQNHLLHTLKAGRDIAVTDLATAVPEVRLARAVYLHQKKRYAEAQETLNLVLTKADPRLQAPAHYIMGNLFLTQAMAEIEAERINQALPLLSLAKQAYRQALQKDPRYWDAKYNLELAAGLLPDFDRINNGTEENEDQAPPAQLWTSVPGFPRGLP